MMHGRIWVESQPELGSRFHFTIEAPIVLMAEDAGPSPASHLEGLTVLVVDDNATNRRILAEMVEAEGMKSIQADSAPEALRKLQVAAGTGAGCSLALIDCHRPGVDGFALVEQIRQLETIAATTILMLTSAGKLGDAARCRALGIAAYLTKPASQSQLVGAMRLALARKSDRTAQVDLITPYPLPASGLRILLAEDNVVNQRIARGLIERQGHSVVIASTGIEVLLTMEQQHSFDIILMDIQMPELNGFEATAAIRQKERSGEHIPIIALTAHAMSGDRERCLPAGMDGYLVKPINALDLIGEINRLRSAIADESHSKQLMPTAS